MGLLEHHWLKRGTICVPPSGLCQNRWQQHRSFWFSSSRFQPKCNISTLTGPVKYEHLLPWWAHARFGQITQRGNIWGGKRMHSTCSFCADTRPVMTGFSLSGKLSGWEGGEQLRWVITLGDDNKTEWEGECRECALHKNLFLYFVVFSLAKNE